MRINIGSAILKKFKSSVMYVASFALVLGSVTFATPELFGQIAYAVAPTLVQADQNDPDTAWHTHDSTPTLTGATIGGTTVTVTINSFTCVSPVVSSGWSCDGSFITTPLTANVMYPIQMVATNGDGSITVTDSTGVIVDTIAPVISEKVPVASRTADDTPQYDFYTDSYGIISHTGGGGCSSDQTTANASWQRIDFNHLNDGLYNHCSLYITDSAGNQSNTIDISSFTVDTTAPIIALNGSTPMDIPLGSTYTEPGATWTDTVDGTGPAVVSGDTVNTSVAGSYVVRYNKTDTASNIATEIQRTVNVIAPTYNGNVSGVVTTNLGTGAVSGTLSGDYNLTITGNVTAYIGHIATFLGTIAGDINGSVTANVNDMGIDTMSGIITGTGATDLVRIIGTFPQTGINGDFVGRIITGSIPLPLVSSMTIDGAGGATIVEDGGTLQMVASILPLDTANKSVAWSVWWDVADSNHGEATITETTGILTGTKIGPVTVIAKALDGSLKDATKAIAVVDTTAPTITGITTTTADGSYTVGQVINFNVTFSEVVNVASGTPEFLVTAGPGRKAVYNSGSGTNTLTFNYTVGTSDGTPTYLSPNNSSVNLNGATIRDAVGNNTNLTLPDNSIFLAAHSITIDTRAPIITITNPDTSSAQSKTVTAVTDEGTLSISVNAAGVSTCNGSLTFIPYTSTTFSLASDNTRTICYRAVDIVGNTTYLVSSPIAGIDTTSPVLTLPADITTVATSASGAAVTFTATANDAVDGLRVVTCTSSSGSIFPIGTTPVSCSASDESSNTTTDSFTVTVTPQTGAITFLKDVSGGTSVAADWTFTISNGNGTAKSGDTKTYPTGSYTITESGPTGYSRTGISGTACSVVGGVINLNVTTNGGTCNIFNTRDTGTITLDKVTNPSGDPTLFNLDIKNSNQIGGYTPFGSYPVADTTVPVVVTVPTGWYGVDETAPTGWVRGSTDCTKTGGGGQMYYNFYIGLGENVTCSFTNTQNDTTKPTVIPGSYAPSGFIGSNNSNLQISFTDNFGFNAADKLANIASYAIDGFSQMRNPACITISGTNNTTFAFQCNIGGLSEGTHSVDFQVYDLSGNISTNVNWTFTVDTISPTITGTFLRQGAYDHYAKVGDIVRVDFESNERVTPQSMEIAGHTMGYQPQNAEGTRFYIYYEMKSTDIEGPLTYSLNAQDEAGNSTTVTGGGVLFDKTAPIINATNPKTIEVGTISYDFMDGVTADDGAGSGISGNISIISNNVDLNVVGQYNVTYQVSDKAGNVGEKTITVNIVDTQNPVITLLGGTSVTVEKGSTYTDAGATATDNYDGDLTSSIVVINPVDKGVVGAYTVTYNVTDANSNSATEVTRTVNVVDTTKPKITLTGNITITITVGDIFVDPGAKTDDGSKVVVTGSVNNAIADSYVITYNATDSEGNKADPVTRTVKVIALPVVLGAAVVAQNNTPNTSSGPGLLTNSDSSTAESAGGNQGTSETLGTETTKDNAIDAAGSSSKSVAVAATNNGWKIFGMMWYWWLLILAAIASAWWVIAARRGNQDA